MWASAKPLRIDLAGGENFGGKGSTTLTLKAVYSGDMLYMLIQYLAAVLDVYSRAIVGWAMSHMLEGQTTDALAMAISRRGVPELVHSDRGSTRRR